MIGKTNVGVCGITSTAWAYIGVTYPEGSICTATNGTITLNADGTSGLYVFGIPEPLSTPETWTVSCTNGSKIKSETVSISTQYQVVLVTLRYSRLPEGYQEVEYLESSGTQYIDSGFTLSTAQEIQTTEFDIVSMALSDSGNPSLIAGYGYNTTHYYAFPRWQANYSGVLFVYSSASVSVSGEYIQNVKCTDVINDSAHKVYHNNAEVGTLNISQYIYTQKPIYLFASSDSTESYIRYPSKARIYSFIIKNNSNGNIIKNFVPCYRISDDVAGMIELVSGTFLTNGGTGTFAVGQDV